MKTSLIRGLAASALVLNAAQAVSDDELVVTVFKNGASASGLTIKLDGQIEKPIEKNGSTTFDLDSGTHSLQLIDGTETVHSFRFDSAQGQLTDISIAVDANKETQVAIESFFKTETAQEKLSAPSGLVKGGVFSAGTPVGNAEIIVKQTGQTFTADAEGNYEISLPRGIYNFRVTHPNYQTLNSGDIRVVSNSAKGLNLSLQERNAPITPILAAPPQIEEVLILADYNPSMFEESERFSANVVDTMGIEQLARFGDSDIAASVVRMPSVTVQDDSFVFIRGLGGRYVTTTLNGSTMPSTNPSRRSVPLDLFPSNIVSQLDVKKTFVSSMPSESTGGNLVINTRTFPEERSGKITFKMGYNAATGQSVATDPARGDYDYLGFDDGSRNEPVAVEALAYILDPALALGIDDQNNEGVSQIDQYFQLNESTEIAVREVAGEFLQDNLDLATKEATPNVTLNANFGDIYYPGEYELGYFAAINYKSGWTLRENGISRTYTPNERAEVLDNFEFEESSFNVNVSALFSLGFISGNNTYESNTIASRVTSNITRVSEGIGGDSRENEFGYTIQWEERQYLSQQFTGDHFLSEDGNFSTSWQFTASQANRYAPDRREVQFNEPTPNSGEFILETSELIRRYDELEDLNFDFSNDYSWIIPSDTAPEQTLTFGYQYIYRDRDADSVTYGFDTNIENDGLLAPNRRVSEVINDDSITGNRETGFAFQNKTLLSDSYTADLSIASVYFNYDILINSEFQFIVGARYDEFEMETNTFDLATQRATDVPALESNPILPSLTFNWLYSEDQQLRFAVSKTASRPDFKERSTAVFYDNEFNFRVRGNPNLDVSEILNADLRWEYYWSDTENLSIALFYKDFEDPIERVVQTASGTAGNSRTFQNAPEAELYGIEIDSRVDFDLNDSLTQLIFLAGNASVIESEVSLDDGSSRELQGQPEYTFNLILGWDDLDNDQELTLLFNQNGKSIVDTGLSGAPDVLQEPFADLKLNYKKSFRDGIRLTAKLSNLLDSEVEYTQGGNIFQSYKQGIEFEAGFDWQF
ncbi:TonB-dependent receptor [Marinibactrum halimedae]|uniref:TonB-dependent receptor n=1 Tax=Marinibactrum halimedae TaxID=1444977 RepID=A0AA37T7F4_9GAMM|nr:TonB-dependent receptor [Marinibactrum halimedae]MCD9458667.1 TonB-dependent receptor [Marinibactrum halimedae]GLS25967.1 TonB-dependent receptor [Marinibactrum halimedae]